MMAYRRQSPGMLGSPGLPGYLESLTRDNYLPDQSIPTVTHPPFKFERRRTRIDWRLLQSIDINSILRDTDVDMLERTVTMIAFGDIEAEDTRHLTETNFVRIFRLSQLTVEYLLYVQDCLSSTHQHSLTDRVLLEKHLHAARLRCKELELQLKHNKKELRRSRKTVKTFEMMAELNAKTAHAAQAIQAPAPGSLGQGALQSHPSINIHTAGNGPAQIARFGSVPQSPTSPMSPGMQIYTAYPYNMDPMVEQQLTGLTERLGKAQEQNERMVREQDDLLHQIRELQILVEKQAAANAGAASRRSTMDDVAMQAEVDIAYERGRQAGLQERRPLTPPSPLRRSSSSMQLPSQKEADLKGQLEEANMRLREARRSKMEVAADVDTMARQLGLVRRQLQDVQEDRSRVAAEYQQLINAMGSDSELARAAAEASVAKLSAQQAAAAAQTDIATLNAALAELKASRNSIRQHSDEKDEALADALSENSQLKRQQQELLRQVQELQDRPQTMILRNTSSITPPGIPSSPQSTPPGTPGSPLLNAELDGDEDDAGLFKRLLNVERAGRKAAEQKMMKLEDELLQLKQQLEEREAADEAGPRPMMVRPKSAASQLAAGQGTEDAASLKALVLELEAELRAVKADAMQAATAKDAADAELESVKGMLADSIGTGTEEERDTVKQGWRTQELDRLQQENTRLKKLVEELRAQRSELELKLRHLTVKLQQQPEPAHLAPASRVSSETSSFTPLTAGASALRVGQGSSRASSHHDFPHEPMSPPTHAPVTPTSAPSPGTAQHTRPLPKLDEAASEELAADAEIQRVSWDGAAPKSPLPVDDDPLQPLETVPSNYSQAPPSHKVNRVRQIASRMSAPEVAARWQAAQQVSERPDLPSAPAIKLLKSLLPHNVPGRPGVITAQPTSSAEVEAAGREFEAVIMQQLDEALNSFGVDPNRPMLTDGEYAVLMEDLNSARAAALQRMLPAQQGLVTGLRQAILHHLHQAAPTPSRHNSEDLDAEPSLAQNLSPPRPPQPQPQPQPQAQQPQPQAERASTAPAANAGHKTISAHAIISDSDDDEPVTPPKPLSSGGLPPPGPSASARKLQAGRPNLGSAGYVLGSRSRQALTGSGVRLQQALPPMNFAVGDFASDSESESEESDVQSQPGSKTGSYQGGSQGSSVMYTQASDRQRVQQQPQEQQQQQQYQEAARGGRAFQTRSSDGEDVEERGGVGRAGSWSEASRGGGDNEDGGEEEQSGRVVVKVASRNAGGEVEGERFAGPVERQEEHERRWKDGEDSSEDGQEDEEEEENQRVVVKVASRNRDQVAGAAQGLGARSGSGGWGQAGRRSESEGGSEVGPPVVRMDSGGAADGRTQQATGGWSAARGQPPMPATEDSNRSVEVESIRSFGASTPRESGTGGWGSSAGPSPNPHMPRSAPGLKLESVTRPSQASSDDESSSVHNTSHAGPIRPTGWKPAVGGRPPQTEDSYDLSEVEYM